MQELIFVALSLLALTEAQIPGIGWCPDKRALPGFDIDRYMGTWYEAERYFTVLEAGSRCARTNYTKAVDGRILVTNEITNRITGIKRVLDGEIRNVPKGGVDSKISVKYSTLPFPMETEYIILDTDYDTYSVVWSCSGLGPLVNTQSAWVMTRERLPPGTVLQKAYAVLDKHKISRTFFVRAEQEECNLGEALASNTQQKTRSTSGGIPESQQIDSAKPPPPPPSAAQESTPPVISSPSVETPAVDEHKKVEPMAVGGTKTEAVSAGGETPAMVAEEPAKPESSDAVRKPAPAITAAPPSQSAAAQQQNVVAPAASASNSVSSGADHKKIHASHS